MKPFSIVVALDEKNGIGKQGGLAWVLPSDLKHFKEVTSAVSDGVKKNAVIMGRKTWDSLPAKFKPLPGRLNIVLSRNVGFYSDLPSGVLLSSSLDDALKILNFKQEVDKVFVIGGSQIYTQALNHPMCETLYVTELKGDFGCDTFFPAIPASFKRKEESAWLIEGMIRFCFSQYQRSI